MAGGLLRERIGMSLLRDTVADRWNPLPRDHGRLSAMDASYTHLHQFTPQVLAAIDFTGRPGTDDLITVANDHLPADVVQMFHAEAGGELVEVVSQPTHEIGLARPQHPRMHRPPADRLLGLHRRVAQHGRSHRKLMPPQSVIWRAQGTCVDGLCDRQTWADVSPGGVGRRGDTLWA